MKVTWLSTIATALVLAVLTALTVAAPRGFPRVHAGILPAADTALADRNEFRALRADRSRTILLLDRQASLAPARAAIHHLALAGRGRALSTAAVRRTGPELMFSDLEMRVRSCESGPNGAATGGRAHDFNYTDQSSSSSASGAWQFLDSTWADFMGYRRAMFAPRWVQDLKARRYIDANGLSAWNASRPCWGS